jgi:hypothetical protein
VSAVLAEFPDAVFVRILSVSQADSVLQKAQGTTMEVDKTAQDLDLSSVAGEFRENYRFLTELINCKDKNNSATKELESLVEKRLFQIRGKLNRRQLRILNQFLKTETDEDGECLCPPVPAELEASIRVKRRSGWLPWEAEAIRKIERWRSDVLCILENWTDGGSVAPAPAVLLTRQRQCRTSRGTGVTRNAKPKAASEVPSEPKMRRSAQRSG